MSRPAAKPRKKRTVIAAGSAVQMKITLQDVHPVVWRRVIVPAETTLVELHGIFQVAMGWESIHLYQFQHRMVRYGSLELAASSPHISLETLGLREKDRLLYDYDLTAEWRHDVRIEAVLPRDPDQPLPFCSGGTGCCPPEDCGGPEGYALRRSEACSFSAYDDLMELVAFAGQVVECNADAALLSDPEKREDMRHLLDRIDARRPFLQDDFSAAEVNQRFQAGDHRELVHQQLF